MDVRSALDKKTVLAELLEQGMVLVTLDARCDGVEVPRHLRDDAQLRLNLSYRFGLPMQLEEDAVVATLTFAGTPYECRLAWTAIYLMVSHVTGRPILFPEDVPPEFYPAGAEAGGTPRLSLQPRRQTRPRLELVTSDGQEQTAEVVEEVEQAPQSPAPSPSAPQKRGHLRVIK